MGLFSDDWEDDANWHRFLFSNVSLNYLTIKICMKS